MPLPIESKTSIDRISPPTAVQASPFVIPIRFFFSISFVLNLGIPRNSSITLLLSFILSFIEVSIFFTTFLQNLAIYFWLSAFFRYLSIAEHYISTENVKEAEKILINLGFSKKIIKSFVKTVQNHVKTEFSDMQEIMMGKVPKRLLN